MNDELHLWSGLYATNALDATERAAFETHLDECADCRDEVAGFMETTAEMSHAISQTPPDSVRAAVLAQVAATRQLSPLRDDRAGGGNDAVAAVEPDSTVAPPVDLAARRRRRLTQLAVAAVAVLVVGVLGVQIARLSERAGEAEQIASIIGSSDAQTMRLEGEGRAPVTMVWSQRHGEVALVGESLDPVDDSSVYELWAMHDGTPAKVALFEPNPDGSIRERFEADLDGVEIVGVTVEPRGGSDAPSGDMVLSYGVS